MKRIYQLAAYSFTLLKINLVKVDGTVAKPCGVGLMSDWKGIQFQRLWTIKSEQSIIALSGVSFASLARKGVLFQRIVDDSVMNCTPLLIVAKLILIFLSSRPLHGNAHIIQMIFLIQCVTMLYYSHGVDIIELYSDSALNRSLRMISWPFRKTFLH